jgi:dihydrofolate reductase
VEVVRDLSEFDPGRFDRDVFVIGGAEIYRQTLPLCTDLYLSLVKREVAGDTFFPEFEDRFVKVAVLLDFPEFEVRHYRNRDLLLATQR